MTTRGAAPPDRESGHGLDEWLWSHTWLVTLVLIAAGLLLRVMAAIPSFLSPDEAWHVWASSRPNLTAVYRLNLMGPHPPLLHIIMYFWRFLGSSEFMLRLPSVLAGTAALWFFHRWLAGICGRTAGFIGLALLAFAPAVVYFSAEVREYSLLVLFIAGALYFLERAFRERSARMMILAALALCLALSVHYSTILLLAAIGPYSLYRLVRARPPARLLASWCAALLTVGGLLVFFYLTHIVKIRGGAIEGEVKDGFLGAGYFQPGRSSVAHFLWTQTTAAFTYLFTARVIGMVALLLFVGAVVLLLVRGTRGAEGRPRRDISLLLFAPFVVAAVAAVAGFYPYSGTRHIAFLVLFAVAGVSYLLASFAGERLWPALLAAVVLLPLWTALRIEYAAGWHIDHRDVKRELMAEAIRYVRALAPPGGVVFSDIQSQYLLKHYLVGDGAARRPRPAAYTEFEAGPWRLVCPGFTWRFVPTEFGDEFFRMAETYGIARDESVCVFSAGWGRHIGFSLSRLGTFSYPDYRTYGSTICVFRVPVASVEVSDSLAARARRTGAVLDTLARAIGRQAAPGFASVLWPGPYLTDSARHHVRGFSASVLPYSTAYQMAVSGVCGLDDLLPALAFWVTGTREDHPQFMRYMDEGGSYTFGEYRFTTVGGDRNGTASIYVIDRVQPGE